MNQAKEYYENIKSNYEKATDKLKFIDDVFKELAITKRNDELKKERLNEIRDKTNIDIISVFSFDWEVTK